MTIDQKTVGRFAEILRARGKQPATIESYSRDAQRFLDYLAIARLSPAKVEPETLIGYRNHLLENTKEKENSVRRTIIGVRQFYRFLTEYEHLPSTPFDAVPIPERQESLPAGLHQDEIDKLINAARETSHALIGARNAVIVSMLAYEGLKATELIDLRWSDYLAGQQGSLRVPGTKARTIMLSKESNELLDDYQKHYQAFSDHPAIIAAKERRVLIAFRGREASIPIPHMTRHGLKFILYEVGQRVGIKHLNTELLRHFAVVHLLTRGGTPEEIMQHLGLRRPGNIAKHIAVISRANNRT